MDINQTIFSCGIVTIISFFNAGRGRAQSYRVVQTVAYLPRLFRVPVWILLPPHPRFCGGVGLNSTILVTSRVHEREHYMRRPSQSC